MAPPLISIVTATYNRSNVLRLALETARRQTCADWELLVIGDACTDDTEAVVASFGDTRIRFTNLPRNHGEQSAPNNAGVARASGRYIAFLNHDDLWFPDHLATLLDALERTGADLAYAMSARVDAHDRVHLWGNAPSGRYEPWHPVPASLWMFRRELAAVVGPWTSAFALFDAPSQDWLRRAARSGARLLPVQTLTAVQITAGSRRNSYRDRQVADHAALLARMQDDPRFREWLLTAIALESSPLMTYTRPLTLAGRALLALVARLCVSAGMPPVAFFNLLRHGKRGGFIKARRRHRGLPSTGVTR